MPTTKEGTIAANQYNLQCESCSSPITLLYTDNPHDHYFNVCNCGHSQNYSIHYIESLEAHDHWESQASDFIKALCSNSIAHDVNVSMLTEIKSKGQLIERIEAYDPQEYYQLGNQFYLIVYDAVHGEEVSRLEPKGGSWA